MAATIKEQQQALYSLLCEFDRVCRELDIPYILFAGTMLGAVRHQGFIPWDDDLDVILLRRDYERLLKEADGVLNREKFFLQKEFSHQWPMFFSKLRLNNTACLEKYHPKDPESHQGVYMDIFPCDNAFDSAFGRKLQFYASKVVIAKSLDRRGYETDSKKKKLFMALCRFVPAAPFRALVKGPKGETKLVHDFFGAGSSFNKSLFPRSWLEEKRMETFCEGEYPISEDYDGFLSTLYGDYMTLPPEEDRKCKQHAILVDLEHSYLEYRHYREGMTFDVYTRSIR